MNNKGNEIIYDKQKDAPQRTSSSTVPSVLNDASFYEDSISQSDAESKQNFSTNVSNESFSVDDGDPFSFLDEESETAVADRLSS